ncbi:MAG: N-acetylmuramoyl-L-alanine amidase family protein [Candidatus Cyclobacteriaceae bacterium M3_2C_046]
MKNIILTGFFSLFFLLGSFNEVDLKAYEVKRVIIDAGHGGKDTGTRGSFTREKDIALDIALKVGSIIKENLKDVEVVYTRNDDTFVPLSERADLANKNDADLFISIHANSEPKGHHDAYGTETFFMGGHTTDRNFEIAKKENSVILLEENYEEKYEGFDPNLPESYILFSIYQSAYTQNSFKLAQLVEHQFENRVKRHSRGVKQAGFIVLWKTAMPSVLIEVGFLSHPEEEKYLNDDLGKTYIASGIFRAIRDYKEELESQN